MSAVGVGLGSVQVVPVRSSDDLRAFVRLPFQIYRHDPLWVPPLIAEQRTQLSPRRDPFFRHAEARYLLARRGGRRRRAPLRPHRRALQRLPG